MYIPNAGNKKRVTDQVNKATSYIMGLSNAEPNNRITETKLFEIVNELE